MTSTTPLQFTPLTSAPSPSFFHALTKHKLDVARLDDGVVPLVGRYTQGRLVKDREQQGAEVGIPGAVELGDWSFDENDQSVQCCSLSLASPAAAVWLVSEEMVSCLGI